MGMLDFLKKPKAEEPFRETTIALAHLYAANVDTFRFFQAENAPNVPGYGHIGSVTL